MTVRDECQEPRSFSHREASPFISPRTAAPDMARGVHFNIVQNIWNTNYVLWYPFAEADQNIRSRFRLSISQ